MILRKQKMPQIRGKKDTKPPKQRKTKKNEYKENSDVKKHLLQNTYAKYDLIRGYVREADSTLISFPGMTSQTKGGIEELCSL